jgi:hypothetical protein
VVQQQAGRSLREALSDRGVRPGVTRSRSVGRNSKSNDGDLEIGTAKANFARFRDVEMISRMLYARGILVFSDTVETPKKFVNRPCRPKQVLSGRVMDSLCSYLTTLTHRKGLMSAVPRSGAGTEFLISDDVIATHAT